MRAIISIDQQSKSGLLSGTTHSYVLKVAFRLSEKEKSIFNNHPLFQSMIFMSYTAGKKKDIPLNIRAKEIYEGKVFTIEAFSVNDILDYRTQIVSSAENFVNYIDILTGVIDSKELIFGEN